jgi:methyl-accepting chemotaxis protein
VASVREVEPVFETVRSAVTEQTFSVAEIAQRAVENSSYVEQVNTRAEAASGAAAAATGRVAEAHRALAQADSLASGLRRRFVTVLRHSTVGDRRRSDRFPIELPARLIPPDGLPMRARTVDLGAGGVLIACPTETRVDVDPIAVELGDLGRFQIKIVGRSPLGLHCAFENIEPDPRLRLQAFLEETERSYSPMIDAAQSAAREVSAILERLVSSGDLSRSDLFDTGYRDIPGTIPAQFETISTASLERELSPVLERWLNSDNQLFFCIVVDRNGYCPVHNRRYSFPQRSEDPIWNVAHCRNKRIFDDRAGLTAARSTRPFIVQTYARDMGGGTAVMTREVDAPIRLSGRHWGAMRLGYAY